MTFGHGVFIAVLITLFLVFLSVILRARAQKMAGGAWDKVTTFFGKAGWWRENLVVIGLSVVACHLILYLLAPEWWIEHIGQDGRIWILSILLMLFSVLMPSGKTMLHPAIGKLGTIVVLLTMTYLALEPQLHRWLLEHDIELPSSAEVIGGGGTAPVRTRIGPANSVELETKTFWMQNLPPEEAWRMIAIAKKESGFRQFKEDNVTPLRGLKNPNDIGVMQINTDHYGDQAEELGYNIYTLDGNLKMALWIRLHDGEQVWNTKEDVDELLANETVIPITAPVGRWSEKYYVQGKDCMGLPDQNIRIRDSFGNEYDLGPNNIPVAVTRSWEYKAVGNTPVSFTMVCHG